MVWYGNEQFKNQTVTAFLWHIRNQGTSNKHLTVVKNVYCVNAVDKSTESLAGSEKGHAELSDAGHSVQPTRAITQVLFQNADEHIRNKGWFTTRKPATETSVLQASVNNITESLRYSKVCARWVPKSLTNYHKTVQKEVCSQVLFHYEADGDSFLS
jgi:hypothetical protein